MTGLNCTGDSCNDTTSTSTIIADNTQLQNNNPCSGMFLYYFSSISRFFLSLIIFNLILSLSLILIKFSSLSPLFFILSIFPSIYLFIHFYLFSPIFFFFCRSLFESPLYNSYSLFLNIFYIFLFYYIIPFVSIYLFKMSCK